MRRGLRVDFLHFSGIPFTTSESIYKAYALVRELDKFQGKSRLWVVPFGKAQQSIKASGQDRLAVITQRRLMLKTAEEVAHRLRAAALITGDSSARSPPRPCRTSPPRTTRSTCRSCARSSASTRPRSWPRPAASAPWRSPSCPTRTAAPSSPPAGSSPRQGRGPQADRAAPRRRGARRPAGRLPPGVQAGGLRRTFRYGRRSVAPAVPESVVLGGGSTRPGTGRRSGGGQGVAGRDLAQQRREPAHHAGQLVQVAVDQRLGAVAQRLLRAAGGRR